MSWKDGINHFFEVIILIIPLSTRMQFVYKKTNTIYIAYNNKHNHILVFSWSTLIETVQARNCPIHFIDNGKVYTLWVMIAQHVMKIIKTHLVLKAFISFGFIPKYVFTKCNTFIEILSPELQNVKRLGNDLAWLQDIQSGYRKICIIWKKFTLLYFKYII